MRSLPLSLSLLSLGLSHGVFASPDQSLDCASPDGNAQLECNRPMKPVTTVTPGAYYIAKVPCPDCKVEEVSGERENRTSKLVDVDNDLFFNISLTRDHRTLLLNSAPIFPTLSTSPRPPSILTSQIPPNFTRTDLADTLACARKCHASAPTCSCLDALSLSTPTLDFDHYAKWLSSHAETQTEKWELTFDAIGGSNGGSEATSRAFDSAEQSVLRIIMQGREISEDENHGGHNQGASPLAGNYQDPDPIYEYEIASIEFSQRYADVPHPEPLSLWGKLRRFFGADVVRADGHVVFLAAEWGAWGKKGSLRQGLGVVLHEWRWDIVFGVVGVAALALGGVWVSKWVFLAVKRQRELARWDGMDQVWARLRRDGGEEGAQLLEGGYRDEVGVGGYREGRGGARYRDEGYRDGAYRDGSRDEGYRDEPEPSGSPPSYEEDVQKNKPLPDKPLPDKPLPAVPLIDA